MVTPVLLRSSSITRTARIESPPTAKKSSSDVTCGSPRATRICSRTMLATVSRLGGPAAFVIAPSRRSLATLPLEHDWDWDGYCWECLTVAPDCSWCRGSGAVAWLPAGRSGPDRHLLTGHRLQYRVHHRCDLLAVGLGRDQRRHDPGSGGANAQQHPALLTGHPETVAAIRRPRLAVTIEEWQELHQPGTGGLPATVSLLQRGGQPFLQRCPDLANVLQYAVATVYVQHGQPGGRG